MARHLSHRHRRGAPPGRRDRCATSDELLGAATPRGGTTVAKPLVRIARCAPATVARPAVEAGSTEHWLMHPWGAHPRRNGREPEATGRPVHAQDGGLCLMERGGPTVQLPPRAREAKAPVSRPGPSSSVGGWGHPARRRRALTAADQLGPEPSPPAPARALVARPVCVPEHRSGVAATAVAGAAVRVGMQEDREHVSAQHDGGDCCHFHRRLSLVCCAPVCALYVRVWAMCTFRRRHWRSVVSRCAETDVPNGRAAAALPPASAVSGGVGYVRLRGLLRRPCGKGGDRGAGRMCA